MCRAPRPRQVVLVFQPIFVVLDYRHALAPTPPEPQEPAALDGWDTAGLTPREREVAALLALGLSNRALADRLVITRKTAANHVQRVFEKLDVRSRGELIARAYERGWVQPASRGPGPSN